MKFEGSDRHFDPDEAEQVGKLMDLICRYALESTIWWEHGESEKPDDQSAPVPTPDPNTKDKGNTDKSKKVPPGMLRGSTPPPAETQTVATTVAARP